MTSINTHAHAALVIDAVNNVAQLFQLVTHVTALPCSVLNDSCHALCL